jgi:hypothetical protein
MGTNLHQKYTAQDRFFAEVELANGTNEVLTVIQQFTNNEQTERTAKNMFPMLQQDELASNLCVVKASAMETIVLLPCQLPATVSE